MKYITVKLTEKEASEAVNAIGYTLEYPVIIDVWGENQSTGRERDWRGSAAAGRAYDKIRDVLLTQQEPSDE